MKCGFPGGPRLEWYDRNPIPGKSDYVVQGAAPHGLTSRWVYTVPAGKKAYVEVLVAKVSRFTAPTTPDAAEGRVYIGFGGGARGLFVRAIISGALVDAKDDVQLGQSMMLNATDSIEGQTIDVSTGGLVNYNVSIKRTEFDA